MTYDQWKTSEPEIYDDRIRVHCYGCGVNFIDDEDEGICGACLEKIVEEMDF